jgi:hypothetical protein
MDTSTLGDLSHDVIVETAHKADGGHQGFNESLKNGQWSRGGSGV